MMDCKIAEQLMPDYVMDLAEDSLKAELEEHLNTCESCRKLCDEMKKGSKNHDEQPEENPFKKVNKVLKSQKKKKVIFICLTTILATMLTILVIGEVNPKSGFPSITRFRYKQKAKEIVQNFFDGNMESLIYGEGKQIAGAELTNSKCQIGAEMIEDYTLEMKKLYDKSIKGKNKTINQVRLKYENWYKTFFMKAHPDDESYTYNQYIAQTEVECNGIQFNIDIIFDNIDTYTITFFTPNLSPDPAQPDTFPDCLYRIAQYSNQIDLYINDLDWKRYILYNRLTDPEQFVGITNNLLSLDCSRISDDLYVKGFNERLEKVKEKSKTNYLDFIVRSYNKEKHALNVQMIWEIEDKNGKKAVMTKDFLQGPWSYQKLDEEEQFVEEDGFSQELKMMLEKLF